MARFHRETEKKNQFEVFVTDRQTDRQSQFLTIMTPGLGAEMKESSNILEQVCDNNFRQITTEASILQRPGRSADYPPVWSGL